MDALGYPVVVCACIGCRRRSLWLGNFRRGKFSFFSPPSEKARFLLLTGGAPTVYIPSPRYTEAGRDVASEASAAADCVRGLPLSLLGEPVRLCGAKIREEDSLEVVLLFLVLCAEFPFFPSVCLLNVGVFRNLHDATKGKKRLFQFALFAVLFFYFEHPRCDAFCTFCIRIKFSA